MIRRIRKARQRVAELYANSSAAQPGEVWTTSYAGPDFAGHYFEAYTAGEVRRKLDRGDTAPEMLNGTTYRGDYLASLPNGAWVTVEYRNPHPVYAGLRNVVTGTTYDHDERGGETGRDVGGDWVPFKQVTGIVVHSHMEVAS